MAASVNGFLPGPTIALCVTLPLLRERHLAQDSIFT